MARYGPIDSAGSNATGSEKKRLREAAARAACETGRYCSRSSSSGRAPSANASGTQARTRPARKSTSSSLVRKNNDETSEIMTQNTILSTNEEEVIYARKSARDTWHTSDVH